MRIAVLHSSWETRKTVQQYLIRLFEEAWVGTGHSVIHLFGPDRFVEADVALVHVDCSVVPEAYVQLARRYPVALNVGVADIRKSRISRNLVAQEDLFDGPVIVKSDLNHGGLPERHGQTLWGRAWRKLAGRSWSRSLDYAIYPSPAGVPPDCWENRSRVVEKFLPEQADGFYFLRQTYFLGGAHCSWRLRAAQPVIRAHHYLDDVEIPTPPEILEFQRELGLDYGKIDFVEHEGRITILDVNKTIGAGGSIEVTVKRLAPGIEAFGPAGAGR